MRKLIAIPPLRPLVAYAHDIVMAVVAFVLAFYLRVDADIALYYDTGVLIQATALFTLIAAVVFLAMRLYRGVWRYASMNDLMAVIRAVTLVVLLFVPAMFLLTRLDAIPRSLPLIVWFILVALLIGPRAIYRVAKDGGFERFLAREDPKRVPVLLIGAGDAAELFIRTMQNDPRASYRVVGVLDEGTRRVGRDIRGVPVLGGIADLDRVVADLERHYERPQRLIITESRVDGARVRDLLERAGALNIALARAPSPADLRAETDRGPTIETRPVAIEDLLGRAQAVLDRDAMRALVGGRRVMVTGAGGSIGGELVRQIARLGPAEIALVENGELALYEIDMELSRSHPRLPRRALLGDVRAPERVEELFAGFRPELVFHAAAFKHVPLVEANPIEGVRTNVLGTRNVADACRRHGVGAMVLISTDKAVNPTSVMGASKRLAEAYCQALDRAARPGETRFATVRFGNVLGSTGSVVPLFQRQLAEGGPITVTHPEIERWFMTTREAVELVLQAAALGADEARRGHIYVLDMGEPIRIVDLARQMIRLAGLMPDKDIEIVFTGLRPGERLREELFHASEPLQPTAHAAILIAEPRAADREVLDRALDELEQAAGRMDAARLLGLVRRLVPEYHGTAASPAGERTRATGAD